MLDEGEVQSCTEGLGVKWVRIHGMGMRVNVLTSIGWRHCIRGSER